MKAINIKNSVLVVTCVVVVGSAFSVQAMKQMPPKFSYDQNAEKVLREYPLGKINMREAFRIMAAQYVN